MRGGAGEMAKRIPLESTIGEAYGFLFSNLISIVGIVWLPLVLFGGLAVSVFWFGAIVHPLPPFPPFEHGNFDPADMREFGFAAMRILVPIWLFLVTAALMITVGLTRKALGQMEGITLVYFDLGGRFWRLLAAIILSVLILAALNAGLRLLGFAWVHFAEPKIPPGIGNPVRAIGMLAFVALMLYATVRLVFFLPAVVIAENGIGLARSWQLGAGNFWRSVVVIVATLLPTIIIFELFVGLAVFLPLAGSFPFPHFSNHQQPDPAEVGAFVHRLVDFSVSAFRTNWQVLLGSLLVYSIALRSLYSGAIASAYRGVTDGGDAPLVGGGDPPKTHGGDAHAMGNDKAPAATSVETMAPTITAAPMTGVAEDAVAMGVEAPVTEAAVTRAAQVPVTEIAEMPDGSDVPLPEDGDAPETRASEAPLTEGDEARTA
jgi:hypothetical protein